MGGHVSTGSADEPAEHRHSAACCSGGDVGRNRGIDFGERAQHVAFHRRHRDAIAVDDTIAGGGSKAFAARDDAGQVQWVGGANGDQRIVVARAAQLAQSIDRVGQRKLLSRHAGDKAASADLAARFERSIRARQIAPGHTGGFASQHATEHDTVAIEQRPREARTASSRDPLDVRRSTDHRPELSGPDLREED